MNSISRFTPGNHASGAASAGNHIESVLRVVLWGEPEALADYYYALQFFEQAGSIEICAMAGDGAFFSSVCGYPQIREADLDAGAADVVLILSKTVAAEKKIHEKALLLGFEEFRIIPCRVLQQIGFDFRKYMALKKNPPSIFSMNCWGGFTCHALGLRFDSPFINLFMDHEEYLRFLETPSYYLSCELRLKGYRKDTVLYRNYPVAACGDLSLYCSHYASFDEAAAAWERRKKRIRWDQLFVMYCDDDPARVERFCALPYERKVCFVPFASEKEHVLSIDYRRMNNPKLKPIGSLVNEMALGSFPFYNAFDLLLTNTFTPVSTLRPGLSAPPPDEERPPEVLRKHG